jgi:hypothetical protein
MVCLKHKDGAPLRPIISAVKTYNYKLAKKLDELLKPIVEGSEYMIRDSFDFVNQLLGQLEPNNDMVSFDVESLFTNIPTVETIEIIIKEVYKDGVNTFHGLDVADSRNML